MDDSSNSVWSRLWALAIDNSLLLVVGAVSGLVWANLAPSSYDDVAHVLHFPVNDIGMVFFFALATKEVVEAMLPGGPLASFRHAAVPVWAAVGGMVGPGALHTAMALWANEPDLVRGWAIPCATDIAFSYLVARFIFGRSHPAVAFLLLLAIADDAVGLVILAVAYPTGAVRVGAFLSVLTVALVVAWWLKRRSTASFWPYVVVAGSFSWVAFWWGGLHPALALVPVIPFIPHEERDLGWSAAEERQRTDPLNQFEHWWRTPVQFVLFFFGLVNAGVLISEVGLGTWVVLAALLLGKPIGILSFTAIAARVGFPRPTGVRWSDVLVVGLVAGIGFTVSLFFATAAFPSGRFLSETKMGALLSFSAAGLAIAAARALKIGRFGTSHVGVLGVAAVMF